MITLLVKPDEKGFGAEYCAVSTEGHVWKGVCHRYPIPVLEQGYFPLTHRRLILKREMHNGQVLVSEELVDEMELRACVAVIGHSDEYGLCPSHIQRLCNMWDNRVAELRGQHRAFPMPLAVKDLDHSWVFW